MQSQGDFHQIPEATDIGLIMANAAKVLVADSLAAYQTFHADWNNRLDREITLLNRLTPDLVLAAANKAVPGGEVTGIEEEEENGQTVYEVQKKVDGVEYEIEVTADGEVLEIEEGGDGWWEFWD